MYLTLFAVISTSNILGIEHSLISQTLYPHSWALWIAKDRYPRYVSGWKFFSVFLTLFALISTSNMLGIEHSLISQTLYPHSWALWIEKDRHLR